MVNSKKKLRQFLTDLCDIYLILAAIYGMIRVASLGQWHSIFIFSLLAIAAIRLILWDQKHRRHPTETR